MLNEIIEKTKISENMYHIKFYNQPIADKRKPGQFLMLRSNEYGERIPLTIAGVDSKTGIVEIFFQVVGATTLNLSKLNVGNIIKDVVGPLGHPTEIKKIGKVLCVAGGVGTAIVYPVAKAYSIAENHLVVIEGTRTKELLLLEKELINISDEFYPVTNDGSYGEKGLVTNVMERLFKKSKFNLCYTCGPVPMMKAVSDLTKKYSIPTIVSLNPIMVDGTGMCGCCRCSIDGETKFACVDGPDFDGHKVDYKELSNRLKSYKNQEQISLERENQVN